MKDYTFCNINESIETKEEAIKLLLETFPKANMWPDLDEKEAIETVKESIVEENICIGLKINNELIGWGVFTFRILGQNMGITSFRNIYKISRKRIWSNINGRN